MGYHLKKKSKEGHYCISLILREKIWVSIKPTWKTFKVLELGDMG